MSRRWRNPWPIEPVEVEGEFTALVEGREYEFEYEARLNPGGMDYFPDEVSVHRPPDMPWDVWERNKDDIRDVALGDARRAHEMSSNPATFSGRLEWRMEDIRHGQGHYVLVDDDEGGLLEAANLADERGHVVLARPWKPEQGDTIVVAPDNLYRWHVHSRVTALRDIENYYKSLGYSVGESLADAAVVMTSSQARSLSVRSQSSQSEVSTPSLKSDEGDFVMENPAYDESLDDPVMYRCKKCGDEDNLYVTSCTVTGEMHLDDEGFIIEGDTEDEVVLCKKCGHVHKGMPWGGL